MAPETDHRVYVVDDDPAVRDSLSLMLSLRGFATATFASADDFLSAAKAEWSGCVLADLRMPGRSGFELLEAVRNRFPKLAVVVVTAHGDVAAARLAFLRDAVDFIEKPFDSERILAAIARATSRVDGAASTADAPKPASPENVLTAREHEVFGLVLQGLHNRQIAQRLQISARTVEVHKARMMEKLGVSNLVELVRLHGHRA